MPDATRAWDRFATADSARHDGLQDALPQPLYTAEIPVILEILTTTDRLGMLRENVCDV